MRMFDREQCSGCGACIRYCPVRIIRMSGEVNRRGTHYVTLTDPAACIGCRRCREVCPDGAVWFDAPDNDTVLNLSKPAPHVGCCLGNIAYALGSAIRDLDIGDRVEIFKKRTVEANTRYRTHDYEDASFFADALACKTAHPDRIVIAMVSSSKARPYYENLGLLKKLDRTKITIIETLNWFNHSGNFNDAVPGGGDLLEQVVQERRTSFAARCACRSPEEIAQLEQYLKTALQCQIDGRNFAVVEVLFPCFYRTSGRPQRPMTYEELERVRNWFDSCVMSRFESGVLKEVEKTDGADEDART